MRKNKKIDIFQFYDTTTDEELKEQVRDEIIHEAVRESRMAINGWLRKMNHIDVGGEVMKRFILAANQIGECHAYRSWT